MKRKIADIVQKLEDVGVEIRKLEWKGDNLDIDCTPFDKAVAVFKEFGYLQDDAVVCWNCEGKKVLKHPGNGITSFCAICHGEGVLTA